MTDSSFFDKLGSYSIRDFLGYIIAIVGAVVFLTAAWFAEGHSFWRDILRDVGIAFLVAIIVSAIYEVFARSHYDEKVREGKVHAVLEEIVHKDIWGEVRRQVIEKDMIREKAKIKMKLQRKPDLFGENSSQVLLWVDFSYELNGLRSKTRRVTLGHNLDNHIKRSELGLPRFEDIVIGKTVYDCRNVAQTGKSAGTQKVNIKGATLDLSKGTFRKEIYLRPREAKGVAVETRRQEITYVPGSYNLTMGEMTQGISIHLLELPFDIVAEVNIVPHTNDPVHLHVAEPYVRENLLLLPGQTIEFRFKQIHPPALP
jgi:uncharacterized membrane protein (DUF485 family)